MQSTLKHDNFTVVTESLIVKLVQLNKIYNALPQYTSDDARYTFITDSVQQSIATLLTCVQANTDDLLRDCKIAILMQAVKQIITDSDQAIYNTDMSLSLDLDSSNIDHLHRLTELFRT